MKCETCRYFQREGYKTIGGNGDCRRHAPQVICHMILDDGDDRVFPSHTAWPVVQMDDWCGEWEGVNHVEQLAKEHPEPITSLNLSTRLVNALESDGLSTVGDVIAKTGADILEVRHIGDTSLAELEQALCRRGLYLAGGKSVEPPKSGEPEAATHDSPQV